MMMTSTKQRRHAGAKPARTTRHRAPLVHGLAVLTGLLVLAACATHRPGGDASAGSTTAAASLTAATATTPGDDRSPTATATPEPDDPRPSDSPPASVASSAPATQPSAPGGSGDPDDPGRGQATGPANDQPRNPACAVTSTLWKGQRRFWSSDTHCWTSPWFAGAHRVMIGFGCNASPWYPQAATCPRGQGIHHGIDYDMPVGTAVTSAVAGTVVIEARLTGPGYGTAVIIRSGGHDIVLAHLSRVLVEAGQQVRPGQAIGLSGMSGVEDEDGPHLHLEVRPAGQTYAQAVDPAAWVKAVRQD